MVAKRIAAVLAAVAMIAGAVWWRGRDGADASSGGALLASSPVVCAFEVMAACDALRSDGATVFVEPAGTTAERLVADDGTAPIVWVTLEPWPAIVEARRRAADRLPRLSTSTVVAGLDVAMFGAVQTCGATPTWTCVAGLPGLGLDDPASSGAGPAVLIALATGLAGADIATVGATDPVVRDGIAGIKLRKPSPPNQDAAAVDILTLFPGTYRTVAGLAGPTSPAPIAVPTPAVRAGVVVASSGPAPGRVLSAAAAAGRPPSASAGMPSGDIAYGLQLAWTKG